MTEQEILESIASMMEAVCTVKDAKYGMACGRDILFLWRDHGMEMAEKAINAWMDWVSECNGSNMGGTMELRYERYVPAIPL